MKNITDKDLVGVVLGQHKLAATSFTNLILESSNQFLRNDATTTLTKLLGYQKQLFDLMSKKGWYQVQNASQQEIYSAQQKLGDIQTTLSM